MNMRQEGSALNRTQIEAILNGEFVPEGEISEHILVNKLAEALPFADKLLDLDEEFDKGTLFKLHRFFSEEEEEFRKTTPVLIHLGYNPVLPQEIETELDDLFRRVAEGEYDAIKKAVMLHDGILRIYPFREWNEILARTALEYALVYYGEQFCPVTLSEQEYNQAFRDSLRTGENRKLLQDIRTGLLMIKSREQDNIYRKRL